MALIGLIFVNPCKSRMASEPPTMDHQNPSRLELHDSNVYRKEIK